MSSEKMMQFYKEQVSLYGNDVRSLAWGSRESQELRFRVFAAVFPLHGKSVLDVGCGLGDFLSFLNREKIEIKYVGVDLTSEMSIAAKRAHPKATFFEGDIRTLPERELRSDFVFASGIFNWKIDDHEADMWKTITRMYELAQEGVAFNVMSVHAPQKHTENYYAEPGKLLEQCQTLSTRALLRHDYMQHDLTVALWKA
ncbi:MAG: class I SAM-dependent methyltransferase [Bdellovibrionota bacterium]